MTSIHLATESYQVRPLKGNTATIASLSRRERHPESGEERRHLMATTLGIAGGVGSVLAVKSAATAAALWAGSPALIVAGVGLAAVMATSGTMGYFKQRSALKAAGKPVPAFSTKDLFKSMFASKAALVAGGMTAVAAALPGALMLVVGSSVAALGAGVHEYKAQRADMRARGIDVGRASVGDAFRTIFKSKSAGTAFLISAGVGSVLSLLSGASLSAPVADAAAPIADVPVTDSATDMGLAPAPAPLMSAPAPSSLTAMPMPEMVETSATEASVVEAGVEETEIVAPEEAVVSAPVNPVQQAASVQAAASVPVTPAQVAPVQAAPVQIAPVQITPVQAAPVIAAPAPSDVVFENTGADGVRQVLYGSGIVETTYPAGYTGEVSERLADVSAKMAAPVADRPAVLPAPVAPAPVAASVTSDVTDANGVRTIMHASGIRETITPLYADAVQAAAPASVVPAQPVQTAPAASASAAGSCLISESDTEIKVDCTLDTRADIRPGSGIDFRAAANPQAVFHTGLSADSDAINAGEFLEDHAVPEALSAYEKGFFKPQMK